MNKKIGIVTLYHENLNYGASLQAYALCCFLSSDGYYAEQISFLRASEPLSIKTRLKKLRDPSKILLFIRARTTRLMTRLFFYRVGSRHTAIRSFNQLTPHSQQIYTEKTIWDCANYDIYITGSDQVWNPDWYWSASYLEFVPPEKKKLSYAASLGKQTLTEEQRALYREKLAGFKAVSVREQDAVRLLQPEVQVPVEWVLDPTLLLSREQWDKICAPRKMRKPYIFAYFLGGDIDQRRAAKAFSRKKGLPIVTLPYLEETFRFCDLTFGDRKLYNISPVEFISLIKHAEYVLTDSFHGSVFSILYQKEFFVFQRAKHAGMSTRIYSLMSLFRSEERFCDTPEKISLSYMENVAPIDYSEGFPDFEEILARSKAFLRENLAQ